MMRSLLIPAVFMMGLFSCKTNPYINASIRAEKSDEDCAAFDQSFKLESNIGGNRFTFSDCLNADFSSDQLSSVRAGDTIRIDLPRNKEAKSVFKLTLDLDAYPEYHYITIGENTYAIGAIKP